MVTLRTVQRHGRSYHYLALSYRSEGKVRTVERYVGTRVPGDLGDRKRALEREVWARTWFAEFERIRRGYHRCGRDAPSSVRSQQDHDFVVEFTFDTNRIEGSTLTLEDTEELLDRGIVPHARPLSDVRETLAHARLLETLIARPEPVGGVSVRRWHRELFNETKPEIAGRWRTVPAAIRGSAFTPPPPEDVPDAMKALFDWLRTTGARAHPVERAADFHLRFESIHPFADGNGRVGRIGMNLILARAGYPMINIRYRRRGGYYGALEAASVRKDPRPFLQWVFRRYAIEERRFLARKGPARGAS